eukprot:TRINITY_DN2295_c0_g1_i1.p1 TRINITY_DN2295_c0_g1~~TRINITY_DN2295_c0_g1_i1.p1  ORF type:complete len:437 (+),score=91.52 TRINITY_DN2295_c0_g1_i1:1294-2604(+)
MSISLSLLLEETKKWFCLSVVAWWTTQRCSFEGVDTQGDVSTERGAMEAWEAECWVQVAPWLRVEELVRLSKTCRLAHVLCAARVAHVRCVTHHHRVTSSSVSTMMTPVSTSPAPRVNEPSRSTKKQNKKQTPQHKIIPPVHTGVRMERELVDLRRRVNVLETALLGVRDILEDAVGRLNAVVQMGTLREEERALPPTIKTIAIVIFINVSDFTETTHANDEAAAPLCQRLGAVADAEVFAAGGVILPRDVPPGKVVKIKNLGDGQLLCVFGATPLAALQAIQVCFSVLERFSPPALHVGIAAGRVTVGKVGLTNCIDVFGDTVNLAARLEQFAGPGQVAGNRVFGTLLTQVRHGFYVEGPLTMQYAPKGLPLSTFYRVSKTAPPPPPSVFARVVSFFDRPWLQPPQPQATAAASATSATTSAAVVDTDSESDTIT